MSARGGRLATGFVFVLVISVVLFCAQVNDDVGRFFIGILSIGAVAAVALAMQAEIHERQTVENAVRFENPRAPVPVRSPSIAFSPQPSHGPRPPSYHLEFEPPSLSVPRFGKGSRTQREPWRLPAQPTQVPGIMADEAVLGELTVRAASLVARDTAAPSRRRCAGRLPARPRRDRRLPGDRGRRRGVEQPSLRSRRGGRRQFRGVVRRGTAALGVRPDHAVGPHAVRRDGQAHPGGSRGSRPVRR